MNIHNKNWAQYQYSYNLANSRENWAQKKKIAPGDRAGYETMQERYRAIGVILNMNTYPYCLLRDIRDSDSVTQE